MICGKAGWLLLSEVKKPRKIVDVKQLKKEKNQQTVLKLIYLGFLSYCFNMNFLYKQGVGGWFVFVFANLSKHLEW